MAGVLGFGLTRPPPPTDYDDIDTSTNPGTGTILSQGFCPIEAAGATATNGRTPGFIGNLSTDTSVKILISFFGTSNGSNLIGLTGKGVQYSVKGRILGFNTTLLNAAFERCGIGLIWGASYNSGACFGDTTEATRDNLATMAVVLDQANNFQTYNNEVGLNAAYTDTTFDGDITVGIAFEIVVSIPAASDSPDDLTVTMTVTDLNGVVRTVFNAAAPVSVIQDRSLAVVAMLNVDGIISDCAFKVVSL